MIPLTTFAADPKPATSFAPSEDALKSYNYLQQQEQQRVQATSNNYEFIQQNSDTTPAEALSILPSMQAVNKAVYGFLETCEHQHLPNYQESAACSNAKIIEAFKKADYPYPDIIRRFADFRLKLAKKIDEKTLNPHEAQTQMTLFIQNMNREEKRRNFSVN